MPRLALPTATLHYELQGSSDTPPLLLLHGATETFRGTWSQQIEPLSADYWVCGFSGGASVALFMALRHLDRVQSLVLVSNNYELDRSRTGHVDFWNAERIRLEEPRWWAAMERMHREEIPRLLEWWAAEDRVRPNFHASDLAGLWVPALVVGGDRDRVVPLAQTVGLYQALPDAQLAVLPGIGHGVPSRRADRFNDLVKSFLARQNAPLAQMVRTDS